MLPDALALEIAPPTVAEVNTAGGGSIVKTTGTIYMLVNTVNGKIYVGQTTDLKARIIHHRHAHTDALIHRAVKKYGWDAFEVTVLHNGVPLDDLDALECHCIWIYDAHASGYNMTIGGGGMRGYVVSAESRARMSAAHKGKRLSPEHRAKIGESNKGKQISPEHRAKISAALTGKKLSAEHRANLSASHKGNKQSAETRAKISASSKGRDVSADTRAKIRAALTGRKHSPESRKKMSEALTGRRLSDETRAKISAAHKGKKHSPESVARMRVAQQAWRNKPPEGQILINFGGA